METAGLSTSIENILDTGHREEIDKNKDREMGMRYGKRDRDREVGRE